MNLEPLRRPEGPFLHETAEEPGALWDALRAYPGARLLRGARMVTKAGVMAEFAAALQFPPAFGANWDALDEALADLSWLGGRGLWLLITDADQVLSKARDEDRAIFRSILEDVAQAWASIEPPAPFHVVMNTEGAEGASRAGGVA
ncbi:MAG TPA: barstar family protein [Holophagaceae bacterium]|nr:barstar family protein [Holophagaceae bacterium]